MSRDTRPESSKSRINKAGKNVRNDSEILEDIIVIENWRASHNHVAIALLEPKSKKRPEMGVPQPRWSRCYGFVHSGLTSGIL